MKKLIAFALVALTLQSLPALAQDSRPTSRPNKPWTPRKDCSGSYGAGLTKAKAAEPKLKELIAAPGKFAGKRLRVKGRIQDVCRKKGCWMLLGSDKKAMRVRFKDYKFFVPTNSKGYDVIIEGYAKETTISEAMAKHYAEESGDKEAAKKIKGPQKTVAFTATGVKIVKAGK